jgi:hypothetical protein
VAWALAAASWLGWAYLLEFKGSPVHVAVWLAGLAFMAAHTWLACQLAVALGSKAAEKKKKKADVK